MVQWLRLSAANAGGVGFISGQGSKIPHAMWPKRLKYIYICIQVKLEGSAQRQ